MAGALISGMVSLLSKPGFIPAGLEEEGQNLLAQLSQIQPVLAGAENHVIDDERVRKWLTNLNAATCDADDLVDELNYEKLCAEAENDDRAADGVSTGLLSLCKISSRKKNTFQNEIRSKLKEVVERMDNIVVSMGDFKFEKGVKEGVDGVAFARGEFEFIEPEEVVVVLSRVVITVRVISIVGVGGSGKKTLAQSVIGKDCCLSEADMDLLQRRLRQELHGTMGVPLFLNMLGSLMRFKKEPAEWREVLHQLHQLGKGGHVMDKDIMIKLWIANGLIDSDGSTNPEFKGDLIFNELVMRYFFQDVKRVHRDVFGNNHEYHGRVVFKVLDLVHDLARLVAPRDHYYNSELNQSIIQNEEVGHVSITGDSTLDIAMAIKAWPNARSVLSPVELLGRAVMCDDFPKPNSLRALHVRSSLFHGDLSELKHMKHLRYLDLSGSMIKTLPEATSTLYCMQTLNLSKCLLLCQLPKGMRYMRSLRHLSVDRCPRLKKMPAHLGHLNCLQTLTTYIIGEDAGYSIGEIKGLNLGGLLELYNLRKVKVVAEANEVDLIAKKGLESLSLCWGGQQYIVSKATNDFHVLEALKPHVGLKVLKIQQYGDPKFADWLANPVYLKNLVELHLILCTELKTVPSVWHLPYLQVLSLKYMNRLSYIFGSSSLPGEGSEGSSELFPALKRLVLIGMKSLKEWREGEAVQGEVAHGTMLNFPVLDELEIISCPKLETMPSAPDLVAWPKEELGCLIRLRRLSIRVCKHLTGSSAEPSIELNLPELESLEIYGCPLLAEIPKCSPYLQDLELDECPKITSIPSNSWLKTLYISCTTWTSLPNGWEQLTKLNSLRITECYSLTDLPDEMAALTSLNALIINECPRLKLRSTQHSDLDDMLSRLELLKISKCADVKNSAERGVLFTIIPAAPHKIIYPNDDHCSKVI
ncbi:hypothetical protein LUZ60_008109 [Juncus effusus]|nr:hypothetical protein LUZ60_008109 [Juncus effusus]